LLNLVGHFAIKLKDESLTSALLPLLMESWKSLDSEVSKISIKIMQSLKESGLPLVLPGLSSVKSQEEMMQSLASLMNHPEFPHKLDFQEFLSGGRDTHKEKSLNNNSYLPYSNTSSGQGQQKSGMMVF
jgi:hypothetical protein